MKYEGPRPSRRVLLGGAATLLGLPFLESLLPRSVRAQASKAPVRLVFIFVPNGIDMATFRPGAPGAFDANYVLPPMLQGLNDLKADFSVVTGLENLPSDPLGSGDHGCGTGAFLTCKHLPRDATIIENDISIDQLIADKRGDQMVPGLLPSFQLGIDGGGTAGSCDQEFSCAYARNISWAGPSKPLPKIVDPNQAFNELFKGYDPQASAAEVARRQAYDKSVIDFVLADVNDLRPKLGKSDQAKLDQYLDGVRRLEMNLVGPGSRVSCNQGTPPPSADTLDYPAHVAAMFDVIELAFACDRTRIVTLMFGNAVSGRTHPFLSVNGSPINGAHHNISHHKNDPNLLAQLAAIGKWEMDRLGDLMVKLKAPDPTDSANQSLLYNSAIFLSSDVSDGNSHNHDDLPIVLAGHGGGALNSGQHVMYPAQAGGKEKISNLFVTLAEAAGVPNLQLGDSTGVLPGILKA